jgi:hypothetical protein
VAIVSNGQFGPHPGTERHPQGRLFKPEYSGSPSRFDLGNWLQSDKRDVVAWHHNTGDFPEYDSDGRMDLDDANISFDNDDRAQHKDLGYLQGMHFGTPAAGFSRWYGGTRDQGDRAGVQGHPVRLARDTIRQPSEHVAQSVKTDEHGLRVWSDRAANFDEGLQNDVESGRTIPYRNDFEDEGSTSFKALRDTARTWGEDVLAAKQRNTWGMNRVSPAQVAAAERGYNPVLPSGQIVGRAQAARQPMLPVDNHQTFARATPGDYMTRQVQPDSVRDVEESMLANPIPHTVLRRPQY